MEDKLIKKTFKEVKKELSKTGKCPDEADFSRFLEGIMDEKESEGIAEHLVSCSSCCDYVVSLNRVINFPAEERLPEVPDEQMRKVRALVKDREKKYSLSENISSNLERMTQSIKRWLTFDWVAQPIPIAVRSGALALLVLIIISTTFLYYQQRGRMGLHMEIIGKTGVIPTRGVPAGEAVEKIIKEGDTLYSHDYCRINFKLDQDAYAYVVSYDSVGNLHQLYPDPATKAPQKIKANTKYTIPAGENNWFQLDSHKGTETVFVLASREPIRDFNETIDTFQGKSAEEVLEVFKSKVKEVKALSFKHQ